MISCVYMIFNKINKKFYLGSTKNFNLRKSTHLNDLKRNKHHSIILQKAYNKYGLENFEIIIYQYCFDYERLELEQYYLNVYKPVYNIAKSAKAPMEGRKHSIETIKKLKKGIFPKGTLSWNFGRKHSTETKEKYRILRTNYKHTLATKLKMSKTAKIVNSISRIDRDTIRKRLIDNIGNIYRSLTEAAKLNSCSKQAICDNLKGRSKKLRNGKSFKYIEVNFHV